MIKVIQINIRDTCLWTGKYLSKVMIILGTIITQKIDAMFPGDYIVFYMFYTHQLKSTSEQPPKFCIIIKDILTLFY